MDKTRQGTRACSGECEEYHRHEANRRSFGKKLKSKSKASLGSLKDPEVEILERRERRGNGSQGSRPTMNTLL